MRCASITVRWRPTAALCILAALMAVPAQAQSGDAPRADLAASYALLTDSLADESLPVGWVAAGAYRVARRVSVVAEAGGNYGTFDNDSEVRMHAFLAGLRASRSRVGRSAPFVQVLMGFGCYCGTATSGRSSNRFTIQPGAGVDVSLNARWGLRLQGDYRLVAGADGASGAHQFRGAAGLVFKIGE